MIRCIIVDDEELAQNVLEKYISSVPWLTLLAKCDNAIEALTFLREHSVDVMFLDIRMPELSGLNLLETIDNPPIVILTTAYSEYALESYNYAVTDYLLKPIEFNRFLKAVNKAAKHIDIERKDDEIDLPDKPNIESIFIYQDKTSYKIDLSNIKYIHAHGNYIQLVTSDRNYMTRLTMSDMEKQLPGVDFIRIHKSYIVNKQKIDKIYGNTIQIEDQKIPIGAIYKVSVMKNVT